MVAGQQYSVSVTMQNNGSTTWTDSASYRLGSANPQNNTNWQAPLNGNRVAPSLNVPPGGKVTFAFLVTAPSPSSATNYNFQWQMLRENVTWFGAYSTNVAVNVTVPSGQTARVQIMQGGSNTFSATGHNPGGDTLKSWTINGNGVNATDQTPLDYSVQCSTGGTLTVAVPAGAPASVNTDSTPISGKTNFTVGYTTKLGVDVNTGFSAPFDIVASPVAGPAPANTGAPYPWQAAVGGVNTASGNKMSTIPLTGWTMRGGMPVGVALTFNSGNFFGGGSPGGKWTATYDTYITGNSGTDATITWGDGARYTFHRNTDGSYNPPAGIYDTLKANTTS